jgi:hypothetical protein
VTSLRRNVLRLSAGAQARLDELADMASTALRRDVSRSAVARAAIGAWLEASDTADPADLVEKIRASVIKQGRKSKR